MTRIFVANISVDTNSANFRLMPCNERINHLRAALDILKSKLQPHSSSLLQGLLVAPEYYFAATVDPDSLSQNQFPPRLPLTEEDKNELQIALRELSLEYPNILIIPGTVFWKKNASPQFRANNATRAITNANDSVTLSQVNSALRAYTESKIDRGVLAKSGKTYSSQFYRRSAQLKDHVRLKYQSYLLFLERSSENFYGGSNEASIRQSSPAHKLAQISSLKLKELSFLRNTAYCYLNGVLAHKYHKCSDFEENYDIPPSIYVPGDLEKWEKDSLFQIHGVRFGIEICLDHACGILKRQLKKNIGHINPFDNNTNSVDIHLVLSASVAKESTSMVTAQLFIHSSSKHSSTEIEARACESSSLLSVCDTEIGLLLGISQATVQVAQQPTHQIYRRRSAMFSHVPTACTVTDDDLTKATSTVLSASAGTGGGAAGATSSSSIWALVSHRRRFSKSGDTDSAAAATQEAGTAVACEESPRNSVGNRRGGLSGGGS